MMLSVTESPSNVPSEVPIAVCQVLLVVQSVGVFAVTLVSRYLTLECRDLPQTIAPGVSGSPERTTVYRR